MMMPEIKIICQLCGEVVAASTLDVLSYPVLGSMFESPDPHHGVPAPWQPGEVWADMRCPYGRIHRTMVSDDIIKTDLGMVRLPREGGPAFIDLSASVEIGREQIIDRTIMVSDDEAARIARATMKTENTDGKAKEGTEQPEDVQSVEANKEIFICGTCEKSFGSNKALGMHRRSHARAT
jgi:hypothetical protein